MLAKPISAQAKRATMNMSGVPAGRMRAMYLSGTKAPSRYTSSLRVARMPSVSQLLSMR